MKFKKLLLPIIGLGGVAAATTPALVSCGSTDLFQIYVPTIEQAIPDAQHVLNEGGYSTPDATELYANHIITNPEIYRQDILCAISYQIRDVAAVYYDWETSSKAPNPVLESSLKISNYSAYYERMITRNYILMSFDLSGSINFNTYFFPVAFPHFSESIGFHRVKLNVNLHLVNVPFRMTYSGTTWQLSIVDYSDMIPDIPFASSLTIKASGNVAGEFVHTCFDYNNDVYTYDSFHYAPTSTSTLKERFIYNAASTYFCNVYDSYHMGLIPHAD